MVVFGSSSAAYIVVATRGAPPLRGRRTDAHTHAPAEHSFVIQARTVFIPKRLSCFNTARVWNPPTRSIDFTVFDRADFQTAFDRPSQAGATRQSWSFAGMLVASRWPILRDGISFRLSRQVTAANVTIWPCPPPRVGDGALNKIERLFYYLKSKQPPPFRQPWRIVS